MLVSSFNLSQSFKPYVLQKTVQIIDQFFVYIDPSAKANILIHVGRENWFGLDCDQ
jgi:hypothetical protein